MIEIDRRLLTEEIIEKLVVREKNSETDIVKTKLGQYLHSVNDKPCVINYSSSLLGSSI